MNCKPRVKILKTGSSLEVQKVVRAVTVAGQQYMIDRVGRIKGTNWLVFGSSTMT